MNQYKSDGTVLGETHPNLISGSLVYIVRQTQDVKLRDVIVFDHYSTSKDLADKNRIFVKQTMELLPEQIFNGKKVHPFAIRVGDIFPARADSFYVGQETIVKQLREEDLGFYADIIDQL